MTFLIEKTFQTLRSLGPSGLGRSVLDAKNFLDFFRIFLFLDETFLKNETILKAGRILEKWENFVKWEIFD